MRDSFFILFLGAVFLWAQNGQVTATPPNGHRLTNGQKQWVQKNRPESNVQQEKANVGTKCSFGGGCSRKERSNDKAPIK